MRFSTEQEQSAIVAAGERIMALADEGLGRGMPADATDVERLMNIGMFVGQALFVTAAAKKEPIDAVLYGMGVAIGGLLEQVQPAYVAPLQEAVNHGVARGRADAKGVSKARGRA